MDNNLRFGKTKIDTSLAEEFLKNTPEFKPTGQTGGQIGHDAYKNKIIYSTFPCVMDQISFENETPTVLKRSQLLQLAMEIEKNIDLFCQLEYLIRKIPPKDVKDFDLRLIIQNLRHYGTSNEPNVLNIKRIRVDNNCPLVSLAVLPQILLNNDIDRNGLLIIASTETAVVCWLFTKLCHDVGLKKKVFLEISCTNKLLYFSPEFYFPGVEEVKSGCHGVVTGSCDVDSAVDAFLASTDRFPWGIRRIFVQENIVKRFEKAIEWKSQRGTAQEGRGIAGAGSNPQTQEADDGLQAKCSAAYNCDGKKFLFEYVGDNTACSNAIIVESYRTVKELLSLLKSAQPFCLSLWSSDVSESNEISLNVDSNIVWINDFGNFTGPPQSSQAFLSLLDVSVHKREKIFINFVRFKTLQELRESWLKLDISERMKKIEGFLRSIDKDKEILFDNSVLVSRSFFGATNNSVCYGEKIVSDHVIYLNDFVTCNLSQLCLFILAGGYVLLHKSLLSLNVLTKIGAPVVFDNDAGPFDNFAVFSKPVYKTKATWASYGTIFAN